LSPLIVGGKATATTKQESIMTRPYADGTARIRDKATGIVHNVEGGSLVWDSQDTGEERGMGHEVEHRGSVDHEVLGEIVWIIYEYPEGAENMLDHDLNGHELVEDFDYGLRHEPHGPDE